MPIAKVNLRERQTPIRKRYKLEPGSAHIVLGVASGDSDLSDPLHCAIVPRSAPTVSWRSARMPRWAAKVTWPARATF